MVRANEIIKLDFASQLQSAIKSGKTGCIRFPCEGQALVSLDVLEDGKSQTYLDAECKGRQLAVPVGRYRLYDFDLSVIGKNGQNLMIRNERARVLDIKSGGSVDLLHRSQLADL